MQHVHTSQAAQGWQHTLALAILVLFVPADWAGGPLGSDPPGCFCTIVGAAGAEEAMPAQLSAHAQQMLMRPMPARLAACAHQDKE